LAGPNNNTTHSTVPAPESSGQDAYTAAYYLEFELARLEKYHDSEGSFYGFMGKIVFILTFLAGASAVVTILSNFHAVSIMLTLLAAILTATNQVVDFKEKARFHESQKAQYSHWRYELERHRTDLDWILKTTSAVHKMWDEATTKYTVHYGVEAMSWNDAFLQTRPPTDVEPGRLFEILTWERLAMHVLPFSREYFVRRQRFIELWPARYRWLLGVGLVLFGAVVIFLPIIFHAALDAMGILFICLFFSAVVFLFLFDAGYHIFKAAAWELGLGRATAHNH
jgi:hypothetical protein